MKSEISENSETMPIQPAWSQGEFLQRLKNVGEKRYHDKHPFHCRMHAGDLSREDLQCWIINRFYYQMCLPVKDSLIISKLPERNDRRLWLERILEHDGVKDGEGGIDAWLILGEAAGIDRERMESLEEVLPSVRFAVDAYVNFCRSASWYDAVASSLTELFAPQLMSGRIAVLEKHYPWIEQKGMKYFLRRLKQAPKDCEHALDLVMRYGCRRDLQESAVKALEFKCDVLWSLLDAIDQACRHPPSSKRTIAKARVFKLKKGSRLSHDNTRDVHVLQLPECVVELNDTAYSALTLCDGFRSSADIARTLVNRLEMEILDDVGELLDSLYNRGLIDRIKK